MITLVTGYNNTGKTTWIAETIGEKLKCDVKLNYDGHSYQVVFDKYGTDYLEDYYCFREGLNHCKQLNINVHKTICYIYPENGLHSSNQSELVHRYIEWNNAEFDIYIETHSDHILNAIRVAVAEQRLNVNDVKILFFKSIGEIIEIKLLPNGFIENWEEGFFDQYNKDLKELFRIKSNKYENN